MIEILPDLWICKNKQLKKYDDNYYLINCSESLSFLGKFKEYKDEIKQNILKYEIVQLYKFIISNLLSGVPVVVWLSTVKPGSYVKPPTSTPSTVDAKPQTHPQSSQTNSHQH